MEERLSLIRGMTRPVLAVLALALWALFVADGIPYPEEFKWLAIGLAGEYAGERAVLRLRGKA